MFSRLWAKLTVAFLLVAIIGVVVVALLANRATSTGFNRFLNTEQSTENASLLADLAEYYRRQGNWTGAENLLRSYRMGPGAGAAGTFYYLYDASGELTATSGGGASSGGGRGQQRAAPADPAAGQPITVDGQRVGTLVVQEPGMAGGRAGEEFLNSVNEAILWAGLIAVALALVLGAVLAQGLTRPLSRLTRATQSLAAGDLTQQVRIDSQDEVGQLAGSFNQLAATLATAERQRQQLFADIAHELRTPLSVIRGQLEGMLDGVFEISPENLTVAHEETLLLARLVEELRTLSLAESGQLPLDRRPVDPGELVRQAVAAFEPLAETESVRLTVSVNGPTPPVLADRDRLQQVLANLLSNALRHAGASGDSQVAVRVTGQRGAQVQISVADNGPGLTPEAQAHVFDRFWRADEARNRDQGGSGLGLAICRGIVEAHGGRIWVESQPNAGTAFIFELPAAA